MSNYSELLKRPEWQKKRLEMLQEYDWKCYACGSDENTLHVHHKRYLKGHKPWEYKNHQLEVLCDKCHKLDHICQDLFDYLFSVIDFEERKDLMAVIFGYAYAKGLDGFDSREEYKSCGEAIQTERFNESVKAFLKK